MSVFNDLQIVGEIVYTKLYIYMCVYVNGRTRNSMIYVTPLCNCHYDQLMIMPGHDHLQCQVTWINEQFKFNSKNQLKFISEI